MFYNKSKDRIVTRIISIGLVCLFFINSITFADVKHATLSPKLLFSNTRNSAEIQAAVICELIEKRAKKWEGKTIEQIYTDDILLWKKSTEPIFEGCEFRLELDGIRIYIPNSNICIRYYDSAPTDRDDSQDKLASPAVALERRQNMPQNGMPPNTELWLKMLATAEIGKNPFKNGDTSKLTIEKKAWIELKTYQFLHDMILNEVYGLENDQWFRLKWDEQVDAMLPFLATHKPGFDTGIIEGWYESYWHWALVTSFCGGREAISLLMEQLNGPGHDSFEQTGKRIGDEQFDASLGSWHNRHWSAAYQEVLLEAIFMASTYSDEDVQAKREALEKAAGEFQSAQVKQLAAEMVKRQMPTGKRVSVSEYPILKLYADAYQKNERDLTSAVQVDKFSLLPVPEPAAAPQTKDDFAEKLRDDKMSVTPEPISGPEAEQQSLRRSSQLTDIDKARIAELDVPKQREYLFDLPLKVLADSEVAVLSDDLLKARLSELRVYHLISSDHQRQVFQTAKRLLPLIPHIVRYFQETLECEPVNISFFGSYLWSPKPRDLDILIVVKGRILTNIDIKDLSAVIPEGEVLEKEIEKISFYIIGQDALENDVEPEVPEGVIWSSDPGSIVDSFRTRTNRVQLVLSGREFVETPNQLQNSLAEISRLLITAHERMNGKFIKKKSEDEHFRKTAKRIQVALTLLECFQGKGVLPQDQRKRLSLLGITKHPSLDDKRFIIDIYEIANNAYHEFISEVDTDKTADQNAQKTLIPGTDWQKTETTRINDHINRQTIHRVKALPAPIQPLAILKNPHLKEFIINRQKKYWTLANLSVEKIDQIIEILEQNANNPEEAIKEVQKAFPELTDYNSVYAEALRLFRHSKVKYLAERLKPFIRGPTVLDFGGQTTDMSEELMQVLVDTQNQIEKAIISDFVPPETDSANPNIRFVTQPSVDNTSLEPNSVDTIIISLVLHHIASHFRQDILSHLLNILRPGGHVIIIEDSYPEEADYATDPDKLIKQFLSFSHEEKKKLLVFFDWFGNRLTRYHPNVPLPYSFETMRYWQAIFESFGFQTIKADFIQQTDEKLDLMPPKAFLVFKRPLELQEETTLERNVVLPSILQHPDTVDILMERVINLVDYTRKPFPLSPVARIGATVVDENGKAVGSSVNHFGQQHAERLAILNAMETVLNGMLSKGVQFNNQRRIEATIEYLHYALKTSPKFTEEEIKRFQWLNEQLGNAMTTKTIFVSLEPCPRCAQLICALGIKSVVYAAADVNPMSGGMGHQILASAGTYLVPGVKAREAMRQNKTNFFLLKHFYSLYMWAREIRRSIYSFVARMKYRTKLRDLERLLDKQGLLPEHQIGLAEEVKSALGGAEGDYSSVATQFAPRVKKLEKVSRNLAVGQISDKNRAATPLDLTSINGAGSVATDVGMAETIQAHNEFIKANAPLTSLPLTDPRNPVLLRYSVEELELAGVDNSKKLLQSLQGANSYIELYYSTGKNEEVSQAVYRRFDLDKGRIKEFDKKVGDRRTKENTITLFPLLKGEIKTNTDIQRILKDRLGGLSYTETQVIPIGWQNDQGGLIRGTVLGLIAIDIARNKTGNGGELNPAFIRDHIKPAIERYSALCKSLGGEDVSLTANNIVTLATVQERGFNDLLKTLYKLIKLLPITPIDPDQLRQIYEHAAKQFA
ncbi:MAG: methyltransferase domain-containing protein [Candidatus Omnitrophica bacterium]|nr:methyltransferase domain-containing protein [Candidatus Omnitrophota bacterium]